MSPRTLGEKEKRGSARGTAPAGASVMRMHGIFRDLLVVCCDRVSKDDMAMGRGTRSPQGWGQGIKLPSPSPFWTPRALSLVRSPHATHSPPTGKREAGFREPHSGSPPVTLFHTPSPRSHMSRSAGTPMMLSRPSSALAPMAPRSRWRRCVGPLRPCGVSQGWNRAGRGGGGATDTPRKVCSWDVCSLLSEPPSPHL